MRENIIQDCGENGSTAWTSPTLYIMISFGGLSLADNAKGKYGLMLAGRGQNPKGEQPDVPS